MLVLVVVQVVLVLVVLVLLVLVVLVLAVLLLVLLLVLVLVFVVAAADGEAAVVETLLLRAQSFEILCIACNPSPDDQCIPPIARSWYMFIIRSGCVIIREED